jgi:KDO2-lipid IV(A) lauroyltransferase
MAELAGKRRLRRLLFYPLEALGLFLGFGLFRLLPVDTASNLGGWLGRTIGPRLPVTRWARRNLRLAMPDQSEAWIEAVVRGMWDNLGRTASEYPHLGRITAPGAGRVELIDLDGPLPMRDRVRPGILVSGHLANWEVMAVNFRRVGIDLAIITRAPNNPLARGLVDHFRGAAGGRRIPKGAAGAKQAIALLAAGGTLGILADQKMNDGIEVPFFGHPAMTAAGAAQLALRTGCPLVPVRIERMGPARFRMTCHPPLALPATGDRQRDVAAVTAALNGVLEGWIGERPQDWLWLHKRWPRAVYEQQDAAGGKAR